MAIDIRVIRPKDFLRTQADGKLDMTGSLELLREIAREVKRAVIRHVLIDTRGARSDLNTSDLYVLAGRFAMDADLARATVALLVPEQRIDKAHFLTVVADNRGAHARAFANFENAIDWLIMDPDPKADAADPG